VAGSAVEKRLPSVKMDVVLGPTGHLELRLSRNGGEARVMRYLFGRPGEKGKVGDETSDGRTKSSRRDKRVSYLSIYTDSLIALALRKTEERVTNLNKSNSKTEGVVGPGGHRPSSGVPGGGRRKEKLKKQANKK